MKIALVCRYFNKRQGIPHDVAELAERFAKHHEVHVFSQTFEDAENESIIFHQVPAIMPKSFLNELFFFYRAGKMLKKHTFDIINFHDPCHFKGGIFTSHAFPRAGINTILEFNKKTDTGIPSVLLLPFKLFYPISDYNMKPRKAARVIAVSRIIKTEITKLLKRPEDEIHIIPNGINPSKFNPEVRKMYRKKIRAQFNLHKEDFVFLFVGYYHLRKGLQFLIKALGSISKKNIKVMVVGDDTLKKDYILKLIEDNKIADRIIFTGGQDKVYKFFAAGDALILPTLYEPFGNVVLEAMGCRVPAIVSLLAGVSDIIKDGENGLLIKDPTNKEEIAKKMLELYNDPEKRSRITQQGYETAEKYSWDYIATQTLKIFEDYNSI